MEKRRNRLEEPDAGAAAVPLEGPPEDSDKPLLRLLCLDGRGKESDAKICSGCVQRPQSSSVPREQ